MATALKGVTYHTRRTVGEGDEGAPRFFTWTPRSIAVKAFDEALQLKLGISYRSPGPGEIRSRIIAHVKRKVCPFVRLGNLKYSSLTTSKVGHDTYLVLNGLNSSGDTESIPFARFSRGATVADKTQEVPGLSELSLGEICKEAKKSVLNTATAGDVSRNIAHYLDSRAASEAFRVTAASSKMWIVPSRSIMERMTELCEASMCAGLISFPITKRDKEGMASMLEGRIKEMIGRVKDVVDSDPTSTKYVKEFKEAQAQITALSSVLGGHAGKLEKVLSRAQAEVRRKVGAAGSDNDGPSSEVVTPPEGSSAKESPSMSLAKHVAAILGD